MELGRQVVPHLSSSSSSSLCIQVKLTTYMAMLARCFRRPASKLLVVGVPLGSSTSAPAPSLLTSRLAGLPVQSKDGRVIIWKVMRHGSYNEGLTG